MKTRHSIAFSLISSALVGLLAGGLSAFAVISYHMGQSELAQDKLTPIFESADSGSYASIWELASPSVVSVVARKNLNELNSPFSIFGVPLEDDEGLTTVSNGSGFLVTADGLIVTNRHVVTDTEAEYVVVLNDGTELNAEVLGRDSLNDIALLRITENHSKLGTLPHLELADSDDVKVGEPVMAIGNALGLYSNTTTAGIVSAKDRQISVSGPGFSRENLVDLIQTDAAINPGNSGGPLINTEGEVIGMNTAIDATAEGIGFAIPANDIAAVLTSYQENGRIVRPFLGVRFVMVNAGIQESFGLEESHGALIIGDAERALPAVIPGSAADKAGLQAEDVVLTVDGKKIEQGYNLANALLTRQVGEELFLEVWRGGELIELTLTLEERLTDNS